MRPDGRRRAPLRPRRPTNQHAILEKLQEDVWALTAACGSGHPPDATQARSAPQGRAAPDARAGALRPPDAHSFARV